MVCCSFKDHKRAFTLMVGDGNSEDLTLNFVAKDETTAKYWTDAFSLLLGNELLRNYASFH